MLNSLPKYRQLKSSDIFHSLYLWTLNHYDCKWVKSSNEPMMKIVSAENPLTAERFHPHSGNSHGGQEWMSQGAWSLSPLGDVPENCTSCNTKVWRDVKLGGAGDTGRGCNKDSPRKRPGSLGMRSKPRPQVVSLPPQPHAVWAPSAGCGRHLDLIPPLHTEHRRCSF